MDSTQEEDARGAINVPRTNHTHSGHVTNVVVKRTSRTNDEDQQELTSSGASFYRGFVTPSVNGSTLPLSGTGGSYTTTDPIISDGTLNYIVYFYHTS